MYNSATITINDIKLDVTYDYEPAIKGGIEEEPQPEHIDLLSAKMGDVDISLLIDALEGWGKVEDALREQRRDAI